jgi:oligopeptidase B
LRTGHRWLGRQRLRTRLLQLAFQQVAEWVPPRWPDPAYPQQVYPPILAVTSLNDTRVLHSEPAKWIASLQAHARGGPFLLKTEMIAGHGGRSGRYDAWHEEAMALAWIVATAGVSS